MLVWIALIVRLASHLSSQPALMGDTQDYLVLASHRPPVYGWMLAAYQWATGGLRWLPLAQLVFMGAALLVFAIELGLLLDSALAGSLAVVLVLLDPAIHDASRIAETESVFLAFVLAGLGLLFRAVRGGAMASLAASAMLFALAAATRTTGAAFLPLVPLVAACDPRLRWRSALRRSGLSLTAIALVLLIGMGGNWARNGRFEIGSFGGMSLLGKALMLIEPADVARLPQAARAAALATLQPAARARAFIAAAPDAGAAMRAQMQSSEDLRFAVFFPAAVSSWPALASADWRERAVLVQHVAVPLIRAHPLGYLRLWARDLAELVLYPNFWPARITGRAAPDGAFPACHTQANCYSLARYDLFVPALLTILLISVAGAMFALLLLLTRTASVLRRRADARVVVFLGCAAVLHASLLLSAAVEAGFVRYTVALHVLEVALVLWLLLGSRARA